MTKLIDWTKSSRCESHTCVEVRDGTDSVLIRDGKLANNSPVLAISPRAWKAFTSKL